MISHSFHIVYFSLDEAIAHTRGEYSPNKHQMDPPEELNGNNNVNDSYANSENVSAQGEASANQYRNNETMSPSRGAEDRSYQNDGRADYSYNSNPDEEYYDDEQLSRNQQYYDSPDGPPQQAGSQDHEFFNAPSGGAEDVSTEGYTSSAFDPRNMSHPEDGQMPGGYSYDDEGSSRFQESSVEYHQHHMNQSQDSSSPIKTDHLKRLARHQQPHQQPSPTSHNGSAAANNLISPTSQVSSQHSVSEFSHSSAMRGAQELLKRNRQRRQEM